MKKIKITDTTLRDAHQSLLATRLKLEDMLPIAKKMDNIGFYSLEVWGGATFDTCMRYLNEDPWERLKKLRQAFPQSKLQMLLRGQNLVGYKHYADDVVDAFVYYAAQNGIDIFRIFDALNDCRNMQRAFAAAKEAGKHVQGTICYTISPVHNLQYYVELAREIEEMGADSLCIKDMAGILTPQAAFELVHALKEEISLPVQIHAHYTSGMAAMTYLKAIEAGADAIDTAVSSMAMGTSQPPTETMIAVLSEMKLDTGLDLSAISEIAAYFRDVRQSYKDFDLTDCTVDINVLRYQIPGGMISNFISQLSQHDALDRLPEVLAEVPQVRKDLGYPPLVTPTSQIIGSQAVLNVLSDERYKNVTNEVKSYLKGLYGRPPGPVNEMLRKKIIGEEEIIDVRPADLLAPQLPHAKKEIALFMEKEEDILSYVIFPQVAEKFLMEKMSKKTRIDYLIAAEGPKRGDLPYYPV